jgi:hypothetical protein
LVDGVARGKAIWLKKLSITKVKRGEMTHYEELRAIYAQYKTKSQELDLERRALPAILAEGFGAFLGCPAGFVEPLTKKHQRYVLPANAIQAPSSAGTINLLKPYNPISEGLPSLHYGDGRFYFGICVFLEFSEPTFPKEVFGILLSAKNLTPTHLFDAKLHISGDEFKVSSADRDVNTPLFESLFGVVKKSLSGVKIEYEPKQGIGFVKFHQGTEDG